jgi:Rrf2 family protein
MTNIPRPNGSGPFRVSEAANLGLHALAVIAASSEPVTRTREIAARLSASAAHLAKVMVALEHAEPIVRTREIAARLKASAAHLAKVMVALEHAGLVTGTRGPSGGYRLNRPARQITLREIYEAIEGPMQVRACLFGEPVCTRGGCALSDYFGKLNRDVARTLEHTRLTDLVKEFGGKHGKQA